MKLKKKLSLRKKTQAKFFKIPDLWQWRNFFQVLTQKEKIIFFFLFLSFLSSALYLAFNFYFQNTEPQPTEGGVYKEGIVGKARIINPLYATSDAERDLVEILFAGLMKYSPQGKIIPDLIQKYEVEEEGKIYKVILKENLFWSDGEPLTSDDIIFTLQVLQNPATKSPYLANWLDIRVEKIDQRTVKFHLKKPYFPFLELLTLKLIPKHIWKNVPLENFPLALYNLKPISSGPYKVKEIEQDELGYITVITLEKNPFYFGEGPFFHKVILFFFKKEEDLFKSILRQEINGFSLQSPPQKLPFNFKLYRVLLPRYFALFFNPKKSEILADKNVRKALALATDKEVILEKVLKNEGKIINSPLLPEFYDLKSPSKIYQKDVEKAKEFLIKAGFQKINREGIREKIVKKEIDFEFKSDLVFGSQGKEVKELQKCLAQDPQIYPQGEITGYFGKLTQEAVIRFQEKYAFEILEPQGLTKGTGKVKAGTRKKLNELCARISIETIPLKLELVTVNQPQLKAAANLIKEQWQELGVRLEIKAFPLSVLEQNYLRPRNYEIILFGQLLGLIPDPFPFWHSQQKEDPGLNLAYYVNKNVDQLLLALRHAQDYQSFKKNCESLQDLIIEDIPAIFLYTPYYLYFLSPKIKGFQNTIIADPSKRFSNIGNWYIKTKRVWRLK